MAFQETELDSVCHVVLKSGRLLLVSGADAEYVRYRTEMLVSRLNLDAELFISGERLLLTVDSRMSFRTRIGGRIAGMGVNSSLFDAVDDIMEEFSSGNIALSVASERLDLVEAEQRTYSAWLVIPAVAGTMAALCRLFGADWSVVCAAFIAGLVSIGLRRALSNKLNPIATAFVIALFSGLIGGLWLKYTAIASPALAFVAAGMILVPGVPLINGISDLVNGHPGIGLSRLATGTVTVVTIGFALFLVADLLDSPLPVVIDTPFIPIWQDAIFSAVAAFGFAILFNTPLRAIPACIACGMISHGLRSELTTIGLTLGAATLLCSLLAGLLAHWASRVLSLPWPTFAFPGTVAMIPGSYVFRACVGGLEIMRNGTATAPSTVAETIALSFTAIILTSAVGVGLLVASGVSISLSKRTISKVF